jgi:hypothetical protein
MTDLVYLVTDLVKKKIVILYYVSSQRERHTHRQREIDTHTQRWRETRTGRVGERHTQTERQRDRERPRETERDLERQRETERETERDRKRNRERVSNIPMCETQLFEIVKSYQQSTIKPAHLRCHIIWGRPEIFIFVKLIF